MPDSTVDAAAVARRRRSSWTFPLAVFLLSAGMAIGGYHYERQRSDLEWQADLSRDAAMVSSELRDRLRMHAQLLRAIQSFYAASREIDAAEWQTFTRELQIERPLRNLQAYGFAPLLVRDEAPRGGGAIDSRQPAWRMPIRYLAPESAASRVIGFDLLSESRRAEAIALARDRDDVVVSRRVDFAGEAYGGSRDPGLLMLTPVYRPGAAKRTVEERRAAFAGVVFAAFRMRDLVESLHYAQAGSLGLRILDEDSFNRDTGEQTLSLLYDSGMPAAGSFAETREVEFGQRNWHLRFTAKADGGDRRGALALLLAGLLLSVALGLASRRLSSDRERAELRAQAIGNELRLSEERFQLAAEGANDGIWDRNLVDGTVWHSDRLKEILGFPRDVDTADVGLFLARVHPDDRPQLDAALERHLRDRQPYCVDYRFRKGTDDWAWFRSHGQGVWDGNGRAVRLVGSIADITAQKEAERRLARYRDFLATVLKSIPHPVFVKNRQREYIAVNAAFCALIDLPEEEILGRVAVWREPLPADVAARMQAVDERVFAGAGEQIDELVLPMRRGNRTVIVRKALAAGPDGEPILVGTLTDVSELRRAERERAAADRQRKAILDAATEVAIIATDRDGRITLFNRGAEKMLGYRADELVGQATPERLHLAAEVEAHGRFLSAELGRPVAGFEVFTALARVHGAERREWTYVRQDGTQLTASLVVTALREDDAISGYLGIATDVSERKHAEAELLRHRDHLQEMVQEQTIDLLHAKDAAERANEAKSEFLANMSHELRTPLHSILSFASLGRERAATERQDKLDHYFQRIQTSGGRLLSLVNDLLDLSKLEAGMMPIDPVVQDTLPLLREVLAELEPLAAARAITFELAENAADTVAAVDATRFAEVLRNLLSNAIKFSPERGLVRIALSPCRLTRGRRASDTGEVAALQIEVRDQGIGIPPDELELVFEKFVQSSTTNTGAGGTGLGLAICRKIVQAHRGSIRACNNPGGGASLIVVLPRQTPAIRQGFRS